MLLSSAEAIFPPLYDAVWSVVAVALAAMVIVTLASIVRHRDGLTAFALVVWLVVALVVPILSAIGWFLVGRSEARTRILAAAS